MYFRRILVIVLSVAMLLSLAPTVAFADSETSASSTTGAAVMTPQESQLAAITKEDVASTTETAVQIPTQKVKGEPILAYIPLDNRPVNVDRVIYQAESAGFKIVMPDADLYTTRLDGQPRNSNGTGCGDPQKLIEWIAEMDETTDYFVISLDQILSGGLVNSRTISDQNYRDEYKIIDKIIELSRTNHVYVLDTVLRLASCTLGYQNADINTYSFLRSYNLLPRQQIRNQDLTLNNVISSYSNLQQPNAVKLTKENQKAVNISYKVRERKLTLLDYMLSIEGAKNIKYFVGVDDSNPQITIQTNEINFIRKKLGDRGMIYSGADELGMMAVMNLMLDYYGSDIDVANVYFGNTEGSGSGSEYDMETVRQNLEMHLASIGIDVVEPKDADIEIVVLTSPSTPVLNAKYINQMIDYVNNNIEKGIPTIVINSAPSAYSNNLEYRMIRECEMSMLLAYSSWGTVGNSIGIALSNGFSRYLYLTSLEKSSDAADMAFLQGLTFSFAKDISYIRGGGKTLFNKYLTEHGCSTDNFYQSDVQIAEVNKKLEKILKTEDYNVTVNDVINNLTGCRYFKGLESECGVIGDISTSNYSAPFYRTYEIRFDINVRVNNSTMSAYNGNVKVLMPYSPGEGNLAYYLGLYYVDGSGKMQPIPHKYNAEAGMIEFDTNAFSELYVNALTMNEETATSLFADVKPTAWYFNSVLYVYNKNMMKGVSKGYFAPNAAADRATLAETMYKLAGYPVTADTPVPADVQNKWYEESCVWAVANNVIPCVADNTFDPKSKATRMDFVRALYETAAIRGFSMSNGINNGISYYNDMHLLDERNARYMQWACTNGIINGKNNGAMLAASDGLTRAEMATMLTRFMEIQ